MEKNNTSKGIGFIGLLTILFIALKLIEVIDWSWWWVLSPTLISWGLGIIGIIIALIIFIIKEIIKSKKND